MGQSYKYTEPTIWALRKNARAEHEVADSLYGHLYGYDPIRVPSQETMQESVRKGSAENPQLNIINSQTNFIVRALADTGRKA